MLSTAYRMRYDVEADDKGDSIMGFEPYLRKPGRIGNDMPTATIQKGGYMTINEAAYVASGRPEAFLLLFNSDTGQIGLQPDQGPHAVPVRKHPTGRSYRINTRAFVQHYDLPADKARRYPAVWDKAAGILVIDLADGEPVMRGGIAAD